MTLAEQILTNPDASPWLKITLQSALERDPLEALIDINGLADAIREHCRITGVIPTPSKNHRSGVSRQYITRTIETDTNHFIHINVLLPMNINTP